MSKSAQQVIADEVGDDIAVKIIARLEQHGYRIIRHRVVHDEEARAKGSAGSPVTEI